MLQLVGSLLTSFFLFSPFHTISIFRFKVSKMTSRKGSKNYIEKICLVGATGQIGSHIAKELLSTQKFQVTALTRPESTSTFPEGILVKKIDYKDQSALVEALKGQDALIITLAGNAEPDHEEKLIKAAAEANVPWVVPNEWGPDSDNEALAKDSILAQAKQKIRRYIESCGKSSWMCLVCGFWYTFSLTGGSSRFGFDIPNRTMTFYDDGRTKINTSTLEQCGRALARLLSLKIHPDNENYHGPTLSQFRNKPVYISSFLVSQEDMFQSVLLATGTTEQSWMIKYQDVKERYQEGMEEWQKGNMEGMYKLLYSRVFYPNGGGNYEESRGLQNDVLDLPKENLHETTRAAIRDAGL
ncbi:hypothetical protein PENCOP_c003G06339 [Penicillium coprophilum]|uniref:NmrA-like domain-containing protein n=1 Tax=Penicillium coprophilum TaxID=36646 RepID=A0A1V6UY14_9EURO|nr:hypothetical protein PENCOP_c003G06339 [Penicillium coprophilum]